MDYAAFCHELKTYLIDNELQRATDFTETTEDELAESERNFGLQLPVAYREWLKVFGKTELLLNFYIESYDFGALEMAQEEAEKDLVLDGVVYDYLLVSAHESSFYTYLDRVGNGVSTFRQLHKRLETHGPFHPRQNKMRTSGAPDNVHT